MLDYTCSPGPWEVEGGKSEVQGHALLPNKIEISLYFVSEKQKFQ